MAKYNAVYRCGHERTVELFGKVTDRMNKLNWYKSSCDCPKCYAEKKQAEKAGNDNYIEVEVLYKDFKNKYSNCSAVPNTWNAEKKSIKIYVPKSVKISGDKIADEMMFGDILDLIPEKVVGMSADEIIAKSHKAVLDGPAYL